jgi:hypothetical protein
MRALPKRSRSYTLALSAARASRGKLPDKVAAPAILKKSRRRMVIRVSARRGGIYLLSVIWSENRFPLFRIML